MWRSVIVTAVLIMSCNSDIDQFYTVSHESDIDILPLIKPYKLWTPIPGHYNWFLDFKKQEKGKKGYYHNQIVVWEVNVVNHIIYGFSGDYFVIIPEVGIEKMFKSKMEWSEYLKSKGITDNTMYDVNEIYNEFSLNYKKIPWYNEVKN